MAKKLEGPYKILYSVKKGTVAHEFIIDCNVFKESCGVTEEDIAKRL